MSAPYLHTFTGRRHDLERPEIAGINLIDVAASLAQICRFTGHTRKFYSVAEHSVNCARYARFVGASRQIQREALMHDAHEAFTGDVASPIKKRLGASWATFEAEHATAVRARFGIATSLSPQVTAIDLGMLITERNALLAAPFYVDGWPEVPALDWPILGVRDSEARRLFLVEAQNLEIA